MTLPLPTGCFVRLAKPDLQRLIDRLREWGYRVIGPTISQEAVIYGEIGSIHELPLGCVDQQEAGQYRLTRTDSGSYFDYVVGPHSLKNYLFPPRTTVLEGIRIGKMWELKAPELPREKLAVLGARSCDLHALQVQDRVFQDGPYVDPDYQARRAELFLVAVNCGRSAPTCFCASMDTGPAVRAGFDLALTELPAHFVVEVGTELGGKALAELPWQPCTSSEAAEAKEVPKRAAAQQHRRLDKSGVHDLLMSNLEHPQWDDVAGRCLACANCTMVCPTCFCSSVREVTDLNGRRVERERTWDSCFNDEHSYLAGGGAVRQATRARYRQWLTHKVATWIDQFGTSGCVGCGRCITWCPVGIDLTQEVAAIGRNGQ
jgi:formate hydrogenlyase subunit 6/NADH:ubiquinone oxidoreductase subunit I